MRDFPSYLGVQFAVSQGKTPLADRAVARGRQCSADNSVVPPKKDSKNNNNTKHSVTPKPALLENLSKGLIRLKNHTQIRCHDIVRMKEKQR